MSESTWDDPRITAYVLGELPEQELADFESELESNTELAAAVEEARSVTGQLESLYASETTATLDDQRREAIVSPTQEKASLSDPDPGSWKTPLLVLAMAASLLLLIGVGPWLKRQDQQEWNVSQLSQGDASPELELLATDTASEDAEFGSVATAAQSAAEVVVDESLTRQNKLSESTTELSRGREAKYEYRGSGPAVAAELNEQIAGTKIASGKSESVENAPAALPELPDLPDLSLPGLPDLALVPKAADGLLSDLDGEEAIGDVQVESVRELGAIVVRGSKRDLDRVERKVRELEELAPAPAESASDEKSVAPRAAGRQSVVPAQGVAREQKLKSADKQVDFEKQSGLTKGVSALSVAGDLIVRDPISGPEEAAPSGVRYAAPESARGGVVPRRVSTGAVGGEGDSGQSGERSTSVSRTRLEQLTPHPFGIQTPDYGLPIDKGRGAGIAGDRFEPITDNPFKRVSEHPLSTFSVDVDTASYSKTRDFLMRAGHLPRPDAVRIEELLNYFDYDYAPPSADDNHPFAARATVTACPWNKEHRLARIALKGKTMEKGERPACNLVFLLDTSGSMNAPNKLPLVLDGMQMLLKQLDEKDQVAITVYAGSAGLVLDSTKAKKRKKIRKALTQLSAGGSTNGGAGIALAYQTARDNFITDGVNRVILCTDGDFNVGTTGTDELVRMVEQEAKGGVFLSVLGFGMGNHNDAMLEKVSGRGNGNYAFIDTEKEARKVLVDQTSGTLVTIAKDVKLQVEFNPTHVSSYRLIGYENRVLAKEDFNDDTKDAGEIGAGHSVTALYEIVPAGVEADASGPKVDDLKYQKDLKPTEAADSDEMLTLKLRYKQPDGDTSTLVEFPVVDEGGKFKDADVDVRFAAAVAGFGMQLRRSEYAGTWTLSEVLKVAQQAKGDDKYELRAEFVELVRKAKELMGQE